MTILGSRTMSLSGTLKEDVNATNHGWGPVGNNGIRQVFLSGVLTNVANPYFWVWGLSFGSAMVIAGLEGGLILGAVPCRTLDCRHYMVHRCIDHNPPGKVFTFGYLVPCNNRVMWGFPGCIWYVVLFCCYHKVREERPQQKKNKIVGVSTGSPDNLSGAVLQV